MFLKKGIHSFIQKKSLAYIYSFLYIIETSYCFLPFQYGGPMPGQAMPGQGMPGGLMGGPMGGPPMGGQMGGHMGGPMPGQMGGPMGTPMGGAPPQGGYTPYGGGYAGGYGAAPAANDPMWGYFTAIAGQVTELQQYVV